MATETGGDETVLIELTVEVVSAYVANNSVPAGELANLIGSVYATLKGKAAGGSTSRQSEELVPAVPVKKSQTPNYLVCLEDGKRFKSLKRHLSSRHNLTPDQYREKWRLPGDYPMVAPNYSDATQATGRPAPDLIGEVAAELLGPCPDRLVGDIDAAGRQHILDHAQAEREAKVQPHCMRNDLGGKAVAAVERITGNLRHASLIAQIPHLSVNFTVPEQDVRPQSGC